MAAMQGARPRSNPEEIFMKSDADEVAEVAVGPHGARPFGSGHHATDNAIRDRGM